MLKIEGIAPNSVLLFYSEFTKHNPINTIKEIEKIYKQEKKDVKFYYLDVTNEPVLVSAFNIKHTPTIIFIKNFTIADNLVGIVEDDVVEAIKRVHPLKEKGFFEKIFTWRND